MGLKLYFAKKEDVPEALLEHYKEQSDGRWMLQGEGIEDVTNLKTALSTEREDRKKAETTVKAFEKAGITDPKAAADALKRIEELGDLDPEKEAEKIASTKFKVLQDQLVAKHAEELAAKESEVSDTVSQIEELMIRADGASAIAGEKGSIELLMPIIKSSTRLVRDNGKFAVEVVDSAGNARIGNSAGAPMTIPELVAELKTNDTYGRAFDASGTSGSGGPGDKGGGTLPKGKVSSSDQDGLNQNLEGIADGSVEVV